MLRIALPHADLWNTWWSDYGNTALGFATLRARVEDAARAAGRGPGEVGATAAVLVRLPGGRGRLMGDSTYAADALPIDGHPTALAEHLHALAEVGAVHVQLVLDPITRESIALVGRALTQLDQA